MGFDGFRRKLQTIDSHFPFLEDCVLNLDDHRVAFYGYFLFFSNIPF